jgi:hypothetical protein
MLPVLSIFIVGALSSTAFLHELSLILLHLALDKMLRGLEAVCKVLQGNPFPD